MGHMRDRWTQPGPNGRRVHSDRWGKGKRWQVRWDTPEGQRSKAFVSKDAARDWLAEQQLGIERRSVPSVTVQEMAERWQAAQLHHRDSTRDTVQSALNRLILPVLGSEPVAQLTRYRLQEVVNGWVQLGYSPARVKVAWSYMSSILSLAELDGVIDKMPRGVRLPADRRRSVVPLTVDQVAAITERMTARYKAMVVVGAASGLRSGELRGLTVAGCAGGVLTVERQLVGAQGSVPVWGPTKSAASVRRVPVGASVQEVLAQHVRQFPAPAGLVFGTRWGTPVSRTAAGDAWRAAVDGLGLPPRSGWHDLRHFHASLLIAGGLSVTAVAERLGHADATETLRTYAHLWPTDQDRAVGLVEAAFEGVPVLSGTR